MNNTHSPLAIRIALPLPLVERVTSWVHRFWPIVALVGLSLLAGAFFLYFYANGLGLAYNDARSHLDIGRRVVEGLKPGIAQIGSVWLPLPHLLMVPTIWNDFMWHSGLSGAIQSMLSFIATGFLIILYLRSLRVGFIGQMVAVGVFALNLNVLYLQSTAMTELLLIVTMTASAYEILRWHQTGALPYLLRTALWVMLSTLIRYDGWFLCAHIAVLIALQMVRKKGWKAAEGSFFLYSTLAGVGIFLWFVWNLLIFHDPLYFALGPFSAHAQQQQIEAAGQLLSKGNLPFSFMSYLYASILNIGAFAFIMGVIGMVVMWLDKRLSSEEKLASTALIAPFIFNVLALFLGHSVMFLVGVTGDAWFNVRYGIMLLPSISIWIGYLVHRWRPLHWSLIGALALTSFFAFTSFDAVTIDDALVGSSQKNVNEVSGWLNKEAGNQPGFILISAASHDAIIFSSKLPMIRFIHEGTGKYWENATETPDRWARWIVMRTNDDNDLTFRQVKESGALHKFELLHSFPFADIYQLKDEYLSQLITEPVLGKQK